jgi:hypothetical protein
MLKQAFSSPDRIFRLFMGTAVLTWGVISGSWWALLGLVPLVTAFTGCPVCKLGIGTCEVPKK